MPANSLEQVRNLCMRRGFVFPGSAVYGGVASFWDYGPLGVELLNNIKKAWWQDTIYTRNDMEGLDAAVLMSRKVWQHSGHEATFSDPLVDNKTTKRRYRVDHLLEQQSQDVLARLFRGIAKFHEELEQQVIAIGWKSLKEQRPEYRTKEDWAQSDEGLIAEAQIAQLLQLLEAKSILDADIPRIVTSWMPSLMNWFGHADRRLERETSSPMNEAGVIDPVSLEPGDWTHPRRFNLMFQSHVGPVSAAPGTDEEKAARVYLRPETAQGIFMNFAHVQRAMARKVPFGVAQIGKAFRNEITPGNFIFRTREFEQMEIEFFIKPPQFVKEGEKNDQQWHEEWVEQRFNWWLRYATSPSATDE